jgi:16S rRNA (adenine(1408)-N(1))-methyltransferase
VLLPWGSLLRALALPDPESLARLRRLGRPGARVRFVFGYDPMVDGGSIDGFALPALDDPAWPHALARRYRDLGLAVKARALPATELRALPTTWAQKLAQAGRQRRFLDLCGEVVE